MKFKFSKKTKGNKYQGYFPASTGKEMAQFVDWIKNWSRLKVKNIFEIGANFAQDADYLKEKFNVQPNNVYVFEAHPDIYNAIKKIHDFNAFNYAVYNTEKEITFNVLPIDASNTGLSSILPLKNVATQEIKVQSIRIDKFMEKHNIKEIDFLKLDVEGCNYEVLEGFGNRLKDVKSIHIEAEHTDFAYGNNKLFISIQSLLENNGFEMVYFQRYTSQSDSFWVQKEFIKNHRLES